MVSWDDIFVQCAQSHRASMYSILELVDWRGQFTGIFVVAARHVASGSVQSMTTLRDDDANEAQSLIPLIPACWG